MDADLVKPFVEATLHILETTASTSAKARKPYLKRELPAKGVISGVIELTGDFNGIISISFSEKLILAVVSSMFGEKMTEVNDEIKDAVGEMTNMISGQVTTKMTELGKTLKAKLSTVVMGSPHNVQFIENRPVIAMPYFTENGDFTIEVSFEKS
ncbi:MAG: chemotaxis protein CheX [Pseudomonadota bacterium]